MAQGLRFECQRGCTECCRQRGFVYLTELDLLRAAAFLGITPAAFERRYAAWHREARRIGFSSNTRDYISLPSYRRIVALGPHAVPLLRTKLLEDRSADFMLADAVVAICGWNRRDFASDSAQAFRDKVLRRLKGD